MFSREYTTKKTQKKKKASPWSRTAPSENHQSVVFFIEVSSCDVEKSKKILERITYRVREVGTLNPQEVEFELTITPKIDCHQPKEVEVEIVGYIGSYVHLQRAIDQLQSMHLRQGTIKMLETVLDPRIVAPGDYVSCTNSHAALPAYVNYSQRQVLEGLRSNLEVIQGPPGTGEKYVCCVLF